MAVFRVEKNSGYTVMSNHHLRNRALSLKAKGLLSQMLSLPEDWDYTLQGLARINRESIDAIRQAIRELEQAGYIQRSRERDEKGRLRGADYVIFELPQPVPASVSPTLENPTLENPTQENPTLENPMQLNKDDNHNRSCKKAEPVALRNHHYIFVPLFFQHLPQKQKLLFALLIFDLFQKLPELSLRVQISYHLKLFLKQYHIHSGILSHLGLPLNI